MMRAIFSNDMVFNDTDPSLILFGTTSDFCNLHLRMSVEQAVKLYLPDENDNKLTIIFSFDTAEGEYFQKQGSSFHLKFEENSKPGTLACIFGLSQLDGSGHNSIDLKDYKNQDFSLYLEVPSKDTAIAKLTKDG